MVKLIDSSKIYLESFRVNLYTIEPFRVIGLIDVDIEYDDGIERVILPFFRSSGTNSGKIRGLWYPIVGIKLYDGNFTEFTDYINHVLTNTTRDGIAMEGWLAYTVKYKEVFLWITIEIGHAEGIDIMDIVNQQTIQIVELIVDPIVGQIAEQIVTQIVDNKN